MTATQRDSFPDPNGDLRADPGQVITYETIIRNGGNMAAQNLRVILPQPGSTTFDPASVKSTPLARNDTYSSIGNVGLSIGAPGLLINDFDLGPVIPTVVLGSGPTSQGGSVTIGLDGSFTYRPAAGFEGTDSFSYTIADESGATLGAPATGSNVATVSINVANVIWFIDASAGAGGDGTLSSPFDSLSDHNGNPLDADGEGIFLYSGSYGSGLTLQPGQKAIGQGAGQPLATVLGITAPPGSLPLPSTGGVKPSISGATGILVATNNTVRGLAVSGTTGPGVAGTNFGTLMVREVDVTSSGSAVSLNNGVLDAAFGNLSSTSNAARGIELSGVSGSITSSGGTIASTGQRGVSIVGSPSVTLGLTLTSVSSSGADHGILLTNTAGAFTVAGGGSRGSGGTISNTGSHGINLTNVAGFSLNDAFLNIGGNGDGENGINAKDLTGICRIDNCFVQGFENAIHLDNERGVLTELKVVDSELNHNNPQNTFAENGMLILGFGDAQITVHVDNTIFEDLRGDGILAAAGQGRGVLPTTSHINLTVHDSDFNGVFDAGANSEVRRAVRTGANANGSCTFDISGVGGANNFNDQIGTAVTAKNDSNGLLQGRIEGNLFLQDDDPGIGTGAGKLIFADGNNGTVAGATRVRVTSNTHTHVDGFPLQTLAQDGAGVLLEMEVGNNLQTNISPGQTAEAWNADIQNGSTMCIDTSTANGFGRNTFLGVAVFGPGDGIVLRNDASVLRLENFTGTTAAQVDTHLETQNSAGVTADVVFSGGATVAGGNCQSHSLPPAPLP